MFSPDHLERVSATTKRNEKLAILAELPKEAAEYFRWSLDPTIKFGVTCVETDVVRMWNDVRDTLQKHNVTPVATDDWFIEFYDLLSSLSSRALTGHSALAAVDDCLAHAPAVSYAIWGARAINKNLYAGVNVATVNKVWPGTIPDLSVMLAESYNPEKHEIGPGWIVEPKLDGYRMTVIDGVPYSRNKRVYTTVDHILKALGNHTEQYVFDGEIIGQSGDFDEQGGMLRRKDTTAEKAIYYVFDVVRREDWENESEPFSVRTDRVKSIVDSLKSEFIKCLPQFVMGAGSQSFHVDLINQMKYFMSLGYEGAMLKNPNAPYRYDRCDDVLKVKDFVSADAPIVDFQEGRGKHKGKLGSVFVDFNGVKCRVGSGFTDEMREAIWKNKESVLGKFIEIQYQNLTKNGSLRFPVFLRFREDKD